MNNFILSGLGYKSSQQTSRTGYKKKEKKGIIVRKRTVSAQTYMRHLANAKTTSQASAVMRNARADLQFVRCSGADTADVAKAERILKTVIKKSSVKVFRLRREAELEQQKKLASSAKKRELEQEIRIKLAKKRKARTAMEEADARTNEKVTLTVRHSVNQPYDEDKLPAAYAEPYVPDTDIPAATVGTDTVGTVIDVSL